MARPRERIRAGALDNPSTNKLTIQLLSVIAENEAEVISKRIKEALQVKKDNITKGILINKDDSQIKIQRLGNPNGFGENQKLGVLAIKENAANNIANVQAKHLICHLRKTGSTFQAIADKLNELKYTTRKGKSFNPIQVQRLSLTC